MLSISVYKKFQFRFVLMLVFALSACGGSSTTSDNPVSIDEGEVGVSFTSQLIPAEVAELDQSKIVYSVEVGEDEEFGCVTNEETTECPVDISALEENDYEMLFTVQYLQDDPEAGNSNEPLALMRASKLPVFNPNTGKSVVNKKPYVVAQAKVKLSKEIVDNAVEKTIPQIDLNNNQEEAFPVFDMNVDEAMVDRFAVGAVCGNNKVEEGEQCDDGTKACDNECTLTSYSIEDSFTYKLQEGFILPEGDEVEDVINFSVRDNENFIQASSRSVGGDVRSATSIKLYQNYGEEDEVELSSSEGSSSLLEYHDLYPGDYQLVITKKATNRKQNIENLHVGYSLETIISKSFEVSFNANDSVESEQINIPVNEGVVGDQFFIRVPEVDSLNDQVAVLNLEITETLPDGQVVSVPDLDLKLVPINRGGSFGRILNIVEDGEFNVDINSSKFGIQRVEKSIYKLPFSEVSGLSSVGEYMVVVDNSQFGFSANVSPFRTGGNQISIYRQAVEFVDAGVCGNGIIEEGEVCDSLLYCSDDCTRSTGHAVLQDGKIRVKVSNDERVQSGSIRFLASADSDLELTVRDSENNCGARNLVYQFDYDDNLDYNGSVENFTSEIENVPNPVPFISFAENSCNQKRVSNIVPTTIETLDDHLQFHLNIRDNSNEDTDYDVVVKRINVLDSEENQFFIAKTGFDQFVTRYYFETNHDEDTTQSSYAITLRDPDTLQCMGNAIIKIKVGDTIRSRKIYLEDECASGNFRMLPEENGEIEIIFLSNEVRDYLVDVRPEVLTSHLEVVRSADYDVFLADNDVQSFSQSVNIPVDHKYVVTFELGNGEHMIHRFPNPVNGLVYKLKALSGTFYDFYGFDTVYSGSAAFEFIPNLPRGTYQLEVINLGNEAASLFPVLLEKIDDVDNEGILYQSLTNFQAGGFDYRDQFSGLRLQFQLADENGGTDSCNYQAAGFIPAANLFHRFEEGVCSTYDFTLDAGQFHNPRFNTNDLDGVETVYYYLNRI